MKTAHSHQVVLRTLGIIAGILVALSLLAYAIPKPLYHVIADGAWDMRASHEIVEFIAGKGLLALIAITALVALIAWRRGAESFILLVSAGVGTISAYASSEIIKVLVPEERPCRVTALDTILACPAPDDWSFPSNHATIAAGLALGIFITCAMGLLVNLVLRQALRHKAWLMTASKAMLRHHDAEHLRAPMADGRGQDASSRIGDGRSRPREQAD